MESKKFEQKERIDEIELDTSWFDKIETEEESAHKFEREAKDYLDTLIELSDNFTNKEAVASRAVKREGDGKDRVVGPGYFKGSMLLEKIYKIAGVEESPGFKEVDDDPYKKDNLYLDRRYTLQVADEILRAEVELEDSMLELLKTDERKIHLHEKRGKRIRQEKAKGITSRAIGVFGYVKDRNRIHNKREEAAAYNRIAERHVEIAEERLGIALSKAYSEKREYGMSDDEGVLKEERSRKMTEWRKQFMGDRDRREKIDYAISLRKKIADEAE